MSDDRRALIGGLRRIADLLEAHRDHRQHDVAEDDPEDDNAVAGLCRQFGLSRFERDIMLLCAGVELDAPCGQLVADIQHGTPPTFALALAAFPDAHWSALLPDGPLRRWNLIDVPDQGALVSRPLKIDERILHLLMGATSPDREVSSVAAIVDAPAALVSSRERSANELADLLDRVDREVVAPLPQIVLAGADAAALQSVAARAAALRGRRLLVIRTADMPVDRAALDLLRRRLARELILSGGDVLICRDSVDDDDRAWGHRLRRFVVDVGVPVMFSGGEPAAESDRTIVRFDVQPISMTEQIAVWRDVLGTALPEPALRSLGAHFDLPPHAIEAIGITVADRTDDDALADAVWDGCRRRLRGVTGDLAQRVEAEASWDSLVLPDRDMATLRAIADQIRHRATVHDEWGMIAPGGTGIAAMFSGASGTGKTLAASVLATELKLDLYRIDLSRIVDKYIGETEKNLRRVFDAAEAAGAILLFDEADALFGKRSDVKDSHDRHANLEVSYLLQRIESYRGLAILTTNLKHGIDVAFLRRLRFAIDFPFPDAPVRRELWRRIIPPARASALDFDRLAQLHLAGGAIRNIAFNAAFRAVARKAEMIAMADVLAAAIADYAKAGRTIGDAELAGWPLTVRFDLLDMEAAGGATTG